MNFVFRVIKYEPITHAKTKIGDFQTYKEALDCLLKTPAWHSQINCMDIRTCITLFDYIYDKHIQTKKFYLQSPKFNDETKETLLNRGITEDEIIIGKPNT